MRSPPCALGSLADPLPFPLSAFADAACAPIDFPIAPSLAIPAALKKAGLTIQDVAKFELNEAFSAVAKANEKILGLDANKLNVNGGAVACVFARVVRGSSDEELMSLLLRFSQSWTRPRIQWISHHRHPCPPPQAWRVRCRCHLQRRTSFPPRVRAGQLLTLFFVRLQGGGASAVVIQRV